MGTKLRAQAKQQYFDSSGNPASGYKVYTYGAGTTTNKATYTDNAQTATNTNPVILDSRGEADIWWNGAYKVKFTDASDVMVWTVDNYGAGEDSAQAASSSLISNFSFETDSEGDNLPDDWDIVNYSGSTNAVVTSDQDHGQRSMKFISTGSGGGYITTSSYVEVSPNEPLSFGFSIKSTVVDIRNVVQVLWYTETKVASSTASTDVYDDSTTNPTSWTLKRYRVTPPSDAYYCKVRIYGAHSSDATTGSVWYDNIILTASLTTDDTSSLVPTGSYFPYIGSTAPSGYLLADGTETNSTAYFDLAALLIPGASNYGLTTKVGDFTAANATEIFTLNGHGLSDKDIVNVANAGGALPAGITANTLYYIITATTNTFQLSLTSGGAVVAITTDGTGTQSIYDKFTIPDLRGRLPLGADNMGGSSANRVTATQADNLGQASGSESHSLSEAETGVHDHYGVIRNESPNISAASIAYLNSSSQNTDNAGSGNAHNNMQPYLASNYIIKT